MASVIKKPVVTEKAVRLVEENNQYTFEVSMKANKNRARQDLEQLFDVDVESVTSHIRLGKVKRYGRYRGRLTRTNHRKFMVFKLKEGQSIDLFTQ